jgi:hypothetical protein
MQTQAARDRHVAAASAAPADAEEDALVPEYYANIQSCDAYEVRPGDGVQSRPSCHTSWLVCR